jgi:tetratricopeptide (TPR) repeat protein
MFDNQQKRACAVAIFVRYMPHHHLKNYVCCCLGIGLYVVGIAAAEAAPYIPTSGAKVVEYLPTRNDPVQRDLRTLRTELLAQPDNLATAAQLAKRYITLAREDADPRYLGYAEAALAPWWRLPHPPPEALILRATVLQSTHRFTPALADLDLLLQDNPANAQAWLTRATVLQVQGNGAEAKKSCAHLYGIALDLVVRACLANVANLNGDAPRSYAGLRAALQSSGTTDPQMRGWVLTLLAEMAVRLADSTGAEKYFLEALALAPSDTYLQGAYADFLLDQGRNREVITRLKDKSRVDGLLLRYALAQEAAQTQSAAPSILVLRDRFDAASLRGDTVHQREQARFELRLRKNTERALALAQSNWQVQREPADVRIYLEAAQAAGDRASEKTVLAWLLQTGLQDAALESLKHR